MTIDDALRAIHDCGCAEPATECGCWTEDDLWGWSVCEGADPPGWDLLEIGGAYRLWRRSGIYEQVCDLRDLSEAGRVARAMDAAAAALRGAWGGGGDPP